MTKKKMNYLGYRNNLRFNKKCKDEIMSLSRPKIDSSQKSLENWFKKCINIYKKHNARGNLTSFEVNKNKVIIWGYKFNGKGDAVYFQKKTDISLWDELEYNI